MAPVITERSNGGNGHHRSLLTRHPQFIAMTVLLGSFAIFLILCGLLTFTGYWFFFESGVDLKVNLQVSRGSIKVSYPEGGEPQLIESSADIEGLATVRINETSQGYLTFIDNYSRQTIATLYLLPNSIVTVRQSRRPRFDFSRNSYALYLTDVSGHVQVDLPANLDRNTNLRIGTAFGEAIFDQVGSYRLDVTDQQAEVYALSGTALLRNIVNQTWQVPQQQYGTLDRAMQKVEVQPLPYILMNPRFGTKSDEWGATFPLYWGCYSYANSSQEPQGQTERLFADDGKAILHMYRVAGDGDPDNLDNYTNPGLGHGETGCEYYMIRDVSQFKSLRVRARFKIHGQSLSTCGDVGTECPIMIELTFKRNGLDERDQVTVKSDVLRHGFYAKRPDNDNRRLNCDTCIQPHEKIMPDVWYIYDSGDLFLLLPPERRPSELTSIHVYASGHAYDVMISDLEVTVGTIEPIVN
ncbi:MAG: hypothetical protein KF716_24605 [Anaerolineae bacterium]|nr:hypothetical protein [Anaerolineae bacterium]